MGQTLRNQGLAPGEHGYGVLLLMIIVSLIFQLATTRATLTHLITILLLGGTFLAALWTSQARARRCGSRAIVVVVVTFGGAVTFAASGEVDDTGARIVSLILVAFAPVVIVHGLIRHFRRRAG